MLIRKNSTIPKIKIRKFIMAYLIRNIGMDIHELPFIWRLY